MPSLPVAVIVPPSGPIVAVAARLVWGCGSTVVRSKTVGVWQATNAAAASPVECPESFGDQSFGAPSAVPYANAMPAKPKPPSTMLTPFLVSPTTSFLPARRRVGQRHDARAVHGVVGTAEDLRVHLHAGPGVVDVDERLLGPRVIGREVDVERLRRRGCRVAGGQARHGDVGDEHGVAGIERGGHMRSAPSPRIPHTTSRRPATTRPCGTKPDSGAVPTTAADATSANVNVVAAAS